MATTAFVNCPNHEDTLAEVKFMLPSRGGRWVFFASCPDCTEQPTTFLILEVSKMEMIMFMGSTPLLPWLHMMAVNVGASDEDE